MSCTAAGCSRPAQGQTEPVPQITNDAENVTIPAHECKQCWEHCKVRAFILFGVAS